MSLDKIEFCNFCTIDKNNKITKCFKRLNFKHTHNIYCFSHFKIDPNKNKIGFNNEVINNHKLVYEIIKNKLDDKSFEILNNIMIHLESYIDINKHKHIIQLINCNCNNEINKKEKLLNKFKICFNHLIQIVDKIINQNNNFNQTNSNIEFKNENEDLFNFLTQDEIDFINNDMFNNIIVNDNKKQIINNKNDNNKKGVINIKIEEIRKSFEDKPENCPVCFSDLNDEKEPLKCGHWVHHDCLIKWKETQNLRCLKCPMCRQELDKIVEKKDKIVHITIQTITVIHEGAYILIDSLYKTLSNMCKESLNKMHKLDTKQIIPKVIQYLLDR